MELSEIFLMAWAIIATIFAVLFHMIANRLKVQLFIYQMGLSLVAEGKAEVVMSGDKVQVREV